MLYHLIASAADTVWTAPILVSASSHGLDRAEHPPAGLLLQAVAALMNQLCVRFPVVAAHNGTSSFAVASPETRHADARAAATAVQTPVHVFNMSTGAKMYALVLSRLTPGGGSNNGDVNPLAPLLQVRSLYHPHPEPALLSSKRMTTAVIALQCRSCSHQTATRMPSLKCRTPAAAVFEPCSRSHKSYPSSPKRPAVDGKLGCLASPLLSYD